MTGRIFLPARVKAAFLLCFFAGLLPMMARAQAVPAATWPAGDTNPADQPLTGQQLGTDLSLNQGVQSITAENESFQRYGLGLEASGGVITNFFATQTNPTTATVAEISGVAALRLQTARTHYLAAYTPQYNIYPEYSEVNSYGQTAYQIMTHEISERAGVAWSTTAARYLSLNSYLPQNLNIGGVGVVAPTLGSVLRADSFEITNGATSLRYQYLVSSRVVLAGTFVGAYFLTVPTDITFNGSGETQRFITAGGNLSMEYQLRPRDLLGASITPVYVYGLQPTGDIAAETVQATFRHQVTEKLQASVAAGPLFVQGSGSVLGTLQDTSYAINASVSRQIRQSQFSVSFNRALIINLLSPAVLSNGFTATGYLPLRKNWILTGAGNYFNDSAGQGVYGSGSVYGAQAQLAYQVGRQVQLFGRYSVASESFDQEGNVAAYSFTRNQVVGGMRFNLGNPTTPGGVQ